MIKKEGSDMKKKEMSKMTRVAQGHEIWLEKIRDSEGDVELALLFGHNLRPDGVADPKRITAVIYSPDGATLEPTLASEKDCHLLKFHAEKEGYYIGIVDLASFIISRTTEGYQFGPRFKFKDVTYAGAFHQMAKKIVPIGVADQYRGEPVHGILEIVPEDIHCEMGSEVELNIFYEGKKLDSAEVKAVSKKEGKEMALVTTDESGVAKVPITCEGEWMFLVRHRDPTKKVSEEYDESVFVSTLVMETVE
ncbi:hypothetical protein C5S32_01705 [ANME-1 cluster archaeon GoMg1]|nr:hypothetical protein [ANME-1 cluster archaeon GoMg1]